jgi:predicted nucleotide-binding protein
MKPTVFIASSKEGLAVAQAIQEQLRATADCQIWTQDAFRPSGGTLDSLLNLIGENDFGIFVFSPDDKVEITSKHFVSARDNVLFETGLFMGRYGRASLFVVCPENVTNFRIPTDLHGFTTGRMIRAMRRDLFQELVRLLAKFATP